MGRRKKEPESAHREKIALAAESLFESGGTDHTTMDEIAREAGYSKATLYVYFKNKDEIIGYLVLKSMNLLHTVIEDAVTGSGSVKVRYDRICMALVRYQEQYPLYFSLTLGKINVDFDRQDFLPIDQETYEVGEQINAHLVRFFYSGIESRDFAPDTRVVPTVFLFWASLAGVIQMAVNKASYIEKTMNLSRQQFLEFSFDHLYGLIAAKETR